MNSQPHPHLHSPFEHLSRWATLGGTLLAFNAGFINSTGVLGFAHKAISHLTGTVTLNAIAITQMETALETGALMGSFFIGAALSGAIIGSMTLKFGRHYGYALFLESALLLGAWTFFQQKSNLGEFLAAMACGLQNALVATMSGSIVRTTHLTGIITDLGNMFGNMLCGRKLHNKHPLLLALIFLAFYSGAMFGTLSFSKYGNHNILFSGMFTGFLALVYLALRVRFSLQNLKA